MSVKVELTGNGGPDRVDHIRRPERLARPFDFLDDDEPFFALDLDREGRRSLGAGQGVGGLGGPLDVLRVDVPASNNHEVFTPPSHVKLAVRDEAEISRA